jgi:hypothetical protein
MAGEPRERAQRGLRAWSLEIPAWHRACQMLGSLDVLPDLLSDAAPLPALPMNQPVPYEKPQVQRFGTLREMTLGRPWPVSPLANRS